MSGFKFNPAEITLADTPARPVEVKRLTDWELEARSMMSDPRMPIEKAFGLLWPKGYFAAWHNDPDGYRDGLTNLVYPLSACRTMIQLRVQELDVDESLVREWNDSEHTTAEVHDFWSLEFNARIQRLRRAV